MLYFPRFSYMDIPSVLAVVQGLRIIRLSEMSPLLRTPDLQNHYHSLGVLDFPLERSFFLKAALAIWVKPWSVSICNTFLINWKFSSLPPLTSETIQLLHLSEFFQSILWSALINSSTAPHSLNSTTTLTCPGEMALHNSTHAPAITF